MSNITRLSSTGSAGFKKLTDRNTEWENQKRINMFKVKGLYPMFLKLKVGSSGFILPGFDSSLADQDTSRPMSVNPYRDINRIDDASMLPEFTNWVVFVDGYTYYGKGMSTFISPAMVGYRDPIVEMRKEIYRRKRQGDNSMNWLIELPQHATMQDKILLPNTSTLAMMNVWATGTNEREKDFNVYKNRVLCLKVTAWSVLADMLNELRPATVTTPRDSNWPHFLLGDVTNPEHAVRWSSTEHMDKNGFKSAAMQFGKYTMVPGTMDRQFNCHAEALPAEALAGRYDLTDLINTVHVPTPEELVELLIEEGQVPYEFMAEVCETFMDMPTPRRLTSKVAPTQPAAATPAAASVVQQPVYATSAPTLNNHPWAQDDPEDNIPMEHPTAQEPIKAAAVSSALSDEEQAEMKDLLDRLANGASPLGVNELIRLNELRKRSNSAQN